MTTPSDASQAVELPPLPDMVAIADGSFNCNAQLGTPLYTADQFRAAIAQDRAARAQAEPVLPEGWVPCTIAYTEGDDPEEIAFGPQRMMDRLKKWLDSYFAMLYAQRYPAARAQGAGEAVADMTDAELTSVLLKVHPMVAGRHLAIARAAILADRARYIAAAEPWLKSDEVRECLEGGA